MLHVGMSEDPEAVHPEGAERLGLRIEDIGPTYSSGDEKNNLRRR